MPERKALALPSDVVYVYDGGFDGFLCCVYESVYSGQLPFAIVTQEEAQTTLMERREIETDTGRAMRVYVSIAQKISPIAQQLVEDAFCTCLENRELALLRYLLLGYRVGRGVVDMLGHPDVAPVTGAVTHMGREVHLLKGFIRFSDYGGQLAAIITPKNFVLPYLARHFALRYSEEEFMIYDKTHSAALVYQNGRAEMIAVQEPLVFGPADEREELFRGLWKRFYNTLSITERENPRCRMTHCPKRYWENMLELKELV